IRSDAGRCPISAQCGVLGVARSAYCWMLEHPEAERADPYEKDVGRVWRDGGKVYGARRIKHALGHEGVALSRRRVNRIMEGNGMAGSYSKAAYRPRPARPNDDPAPNILAREFNGYAPRTHLASDPAYVRVGSSWAYVCLPGDLANRQIAGHSVGVRHDADLVLAAFAALRFPLDEIEVFHTDRGGGFTGERIERMLDVFGITRSLSGPGSPYDNAVVESTDRLVKKELIYANTYTSVERLRSDLNRYVWWYNHRRLHSTLGYLSPLEFTQQGKTL
ncbi:IS3 family transposase, partial [Bifidobacterium sp. 2450]|uniref:IS3 family transposase n=1 Tax=Bifidobacterium sp. 2450 TaxID=3342075 RepID=UPI0035A8670B